MPGEWGLISGTSFFLDREKAQRLEFTSSNDYTVVGAFMYFGVPSVVGDGNVTAKIYDVADDGGPSDLLGESLPVAVSELSLPDTTGIAETLFFFPDSLDMRPSGSEFFVSLDLSRLYETGDTVAVFQTVFDCGDAENTWDFLDDSLWFNLGELWSDQLQIDYLINGVVNFDETVSADDYIATDGLQLHPAYPNPAREQVAINFSLESAGNVTLYTYDVTGKKIMDRDLGLKSSGRHEEILVTGSYPAGTYVYRISTGEGELSSIFIVE